MHSYTHSQLERPNVNDDDLAEEPGDAEADNLLVNLDYLLDGLLLELSDEDALLMRGVIYSQQIVETMILSSANMSKVINLAVKCRYYIYVHMPSFPGVCLCRVRLAGPGDMLLRI